MIKSRPVSSVDEGTVRTWFPLVEVAHAKTAGVLSGLEICFDRVLMRYVAAIRFTTFSTAWYVERAASGGGSDEKAGQQSVGVRMPGVYGRWFCSAEKANSSRS